MERIENGKKILHFPSQSGAIEYGFSRRHKLKTLYLSKEQYHHSDPDSTIL